jgi:Na+/phosphate symporter
MKKEIKDALKTLHEMGNDAEECIFLLQTAFIYNSSPMLKDCRTRIKNIIKSEPQLTKIIVELTKDNPDLKPYISVNLHLLRIGENIEKLAELIDKKIKDSILFSDRAVTELTFLLQRLIDLLRPTSEMILARNIFLSKYIEESQTEIGKKATEYATLHEDRIIEGLCAPVASSLYISILDIIKNVAWHSKEIATKLSG